MFLYLNIIPHPLDESRYGLNGTPTAAHCRVPTPWNRITIIPVILPSTLRASYRCLNRSRRFIPRRRVLYREVPMSQAQDAQERPLLCTPMDAPFNPSN